MWVGLSLLVGNELLYLWLGILSLVISFYTAFLDSIFRKFLVGLSSSRMVKFLRFFHSFSRCSSSSLLILSLMSFALCLSFIQSALLSLAFSSFRLFFCSILFSLLYFWVVNLGSIRIISSSVLFFPHLEASD